MDAHWLPLYSFGLSELDTQPDTTSFTYHNHTIQHAVSYLVGVLRHFQHK